MIGVEHLVPVEQDLDRAAGLEREGGAGNFVGKRVGLPPEPSADLRLDDADAVHREAQHLRQGSVEIVRDLGGAPHREPAVRCGFRDGALGFRERVRYAGEGGPDPYGGRGVAERRVHIAKMLNDLLLDVRVVEAFLVNGHIHPVPSHARVRIFRERLDLDLDRR